MNKSILTIAGAVLALAMMPASSAIDLTGDCRSNETLGNTIVPPPPDAVVNWLPDCITIRNGDTVRWTNADAVPVHAMELPAQFRLDRAQTVAPSAIAPGCLSSVAGATSRSLGALVVPDVDHDTARITYDAETGKLGFELTAARAAKATTPGGPDAPASESFTCDATGPTAASFTVADGVVTLKYGCIFHHGAMTGTIKIVL